MTVYVRWTASDGREGQLRITSRDRRAWESRYEQAWYTAELSEAKLLQAAGLAAIRLGQWIGTLDEWIELVDDLMQIVVDDEPAGPTPKGPGDDSS